MKLRNKFLLVLVFGIIFLSLASAGTINVTLDNPPNESVQYTNPTIFNATVSTDASSIVNISLWDNSTGVWKLNETNNPSYQSTDYLIAGQPGTYGTYSATAYGGGKVLIGSYDIQIQNVTLYTGNTATKVYIEWENHTVRYTATVSGMVADFGGVILESGQNFYITSGKDGATYTLPYRVFSSGMYPRGGTYFNLTTGYYGSEAGNTHYGITNIYANILVPSFSKTILDYMEWNIQACDSDGDCGFAVSNYTVSPDSTPPTISISSPETVIDTHSIGNALWLNTTINDTNLEDCWYEYNGVNNSFSCTSGVEANEEFNTVQGKQSITVYANDSLGNIGSESVSWIYNFVENSATYSDPAYETSQETFILNFTTGITVQSISANLIYDGDEYESTTSCSSGTCILTNIIDLPILSAGAVNNTFYWEFTIFNGTGSNTYNSTSRTQEVNPIILIECNGTYTTKALNFTAFDEGNLSKIEPFSLQGTFNYWLGNGDTYKTYTFSNSSTNEVDLCISPTDKNFYIDASISYDSSAGSYTERTYYFDDHIINNSLQNITLLLLDSEDSTSFIQEVLISQLGVQDALIYTYKYFPGIDDYLITQITKTNSNGQTVGFYEAEVSNYKHDIYIAGILSYSEDEAYKIIPSSTPYTITFNLGTPVGTPWLVYDDELQLNKSLSFNPTTEITTYLYVDTNTTNEGGRLIIIKENYATADEVLYNSTSALSSATLNYDLTGESGNFIAQAFIIRNGEEILVDQIRFTIDDKRSTFGDAGVLLAWFIILVAMMAFIYDAVIGLITTNLAIIFVNLIGFVSFGLVYIFGILITSIIIIWIMKK